MNKKSLKINYIYNLIGQVLSLIIPVITTPYLARIFHEEGTGIISYSNNIINYFVVFANLGFSVYGQREIAKIQNDKYLRSKVFWEIFLVKVFLTVISISVLFITNLNGLYGERYITYIAILAIQVIAVAFDVNFFYQGEEDFKSIAVRNIFLKVITMICIFTFVKKYEDIWIYLLCYSLSILLVNLIMWIKLKKWLQFIKIKELQFKKHIKPSLIIFLPALVTTIYGSLDKLMIGFLTENPDYENGNYGQALKINQILLVIITVIDSILIVRNSNDFKNKNTRNFKNHIYGAIDYVYHIGFPMVFGVSLMGANLCSWFLGKGYVDVPILLMIMSVRFIVCGFTNIFGNQLFIVMGKEKYPLYAHIFTAISNLILNFILIPPFGAVGGAITTAIAEVIDGVVLLFIAIKKCYVEFSKIYKLAIKPILACIPMSIILIIMNHIFDYGVLSFFFITFIGMGTYFITLLVINDKFVFLSLNKIFDKQIKKYNIKFLNNIEHIDYVEVDDDCLPYLYID